MNDATNDRPVQTSATHPLAVDVIAAAHMKGLAGRLGMTLAPGKKDLNGYTGAHDRDLDADLERLFALFPATVFVSLMEDFEYPRFKIAGLFPAVKGRGATVVHFPIQDVSVPTNEAAFRVLIERLYGLVVAGERVVVHCKGGFGRTGLVVAAVLVRMGYTADEAIALTRATRAGTIQTTSQERWVHRYAAPRRRVAT